MNLGLNDILIIAIYLSAIAAANLLASKYGPNVTVLNALLFIGLDLTTRDKLHESWKNNYLVIKMFILISLGSLITWLINKDAGKIAFASLIAFTSAGIIDTIIYHLLKDRTKLVKINGSNIFSAAADSIIFPTLAFGSLLPMIALGQFLAKVLSGFGWSLLIRKV